MNMKDVTVGVPSFYRPEKVRICLSSLKESPWTFNEIIVGDNGEITDEKKEVYNRFRKDLPLTVQDLDSEKGLSEARNAIVDEMSGDYLLLVDDDMSVPDSIGILKRILEKKEDIGGVSGMLYEEGHYRAAAHNISLEESFNKTVLVRGIQEKVTENIEMDSGDKYIFIYDVIPNAGLFRKECLEEVQWDSEYKIEYEHIDFYLNHKLNTSWKFALAEEVIFGHYPGGSINYDSERNSEEKHNNSEKHFKQKWGIDNIAWVDKHHYPDMGWKRDLKNSAKRKLPPWLFPKIEDFWRRF